MSLDLALGFRDETQAQRIPEASGDEAQAESAGIPERIQQRRPRTQLVQALPSPGQMIGLFMRSLEKLGAQAGSRATAAWAV
jgi:hypothetical protein